MRDLWVSMVLKYDGFPHWRTVKCDFEKNRHLLRLALGQGLAWIISTRQRLAYSWEIKNVTNLSKLECKMEVYNLSGRICNRYSMPLKCVKYEIYACRISMQDFLRKQNGSRSCTSSLGLILYFLMKSSKRLREPQKFNFDPLPWSKHWLNPSHLLKHFRHLLHLHWPVQSSVVTHTDYSDSH